MKHPQPEQVKLLAINFGGLGDEVLFLPTLKSIRSAHPSWSVTLLTEPRARAIEQVTNLVDSVVAFNIKKRPLTLSDYMQLINILRGGGFDIVLSSGGSPQVAGLLFLSGARKRVGYATNLLAKILLTNPVTLNKRQNASFMYHDLVHGLGINDSADRPEILVSPEHVEAMRIVVATADGAKRNKVLIHPGTSKLALDKGVIKTWAPERWAALCHALIDGYGAQVILAGGPDDSDTIESITEALHKNLAPEMLNRGLTSAVGKTRDLRDLVALMHLSDLIICVDSAPMHLAVGLNKPLVALFGPTDPQKLLWPSPNFIAVRAQADVERWGDKDPFGQALAPVQDSKGLKPEDYIQASVEAVTRAIDSLIARVP